MRTLVLSIITALSFSSAYADEKCSNEPTQPANAFIQAAVEQYPDLDAETLKTVASMYELAYNQHTLANNVETTEQQREFAIRAEELAMKVIAMQLFAVKAIPQMESVLERMQAEEAAGLKQVSDELKPEVRQSARTILAMGLVWTEFSNEVLQLSADRFIAIADSGNTTDMLDTAQHTICTFESVMDLMDGVVDFFPGAVTLAYVERLNY